MVNKQIFVKPKGTADILCKYNMVFLYWCWNAVSINMLKTIMPFSTWLTLLEYRHIIPVYKIFDSVYDYGCQESAAGWLVLPLTASILTYFITGWIENLYSQATLIRKLQPAKLEKNLFFWQDYRIERWKDAGESDYILLVNNYIKLLHMRLISFMQNHNLKIPFYKREKSYPNERSDKLYIL